MARRPVGKRSVDNDGTVRVRCGAGRPTAKDRCTRDKAIAARDRRLAELAEEPLSLIAAAGTMSRDTPIGELARWWLTNVQRHQVRASTWAQPEDRVRPIEDTLGAVPVAKLKVDQVIAWQGSLLETLAPKTVGHHRQTLAQVLDQAVELGLISSNDERLIQPFASSTMSAP